MIIHFLISVLMAPAFATHQVQLLSQEIGQAQLEMIESAKIEVLTSDFLIWDDEASHIKLALLMEAAQKHPHLKVKVLVDAFHNMMPPEAQLAAFQAGVEIRLFNPKSFCLGKTSLRRMLVRYHEKGVIVDGIQAMATDINTRNHYWGWDGVNPDGSSTRPMRSRALRISGPVVQEMRQSFLNFWESAEVSAPKIAFATEEVVSKERQRMARRQKLLRLALRAARIDLDAPDALGYPEILHVTAGGVRSAKLKLSSSLETFRQRPVRTKTIWSGIEVEDVLYSHDSFAQKGVGPGTERDIQNFILGATSTLTIASPYLILTPLMKETLEGALANGVSVRVLTNSRLSSDNSMTQAAYELRLEELASMGLEIWEYNGPLIMHAKNMVRDEHKTGLGAVYVGGYNLDFRSERWNMENGLYVQSDELARQLAHDLEHDLRGSTLVAQGGRILLSKEHERRDHPVPLRRRILNRYLGEHF